MVDSDPRQPDPEPVAPEPPLPGDCCGDGCRRCVNDVYAEACQRYEHELAAWRLRHGSAAD